MESRIDPLNGLFREIVCLIEVLDLGDSELSAQVEQAVLDLQPAYDRAMAMAFGPDDARAAYFSITAGAGGREACNWVMMLWRMYEKWFAKLGLEAEERDVIYNEPDGVKGVVLRVDGEMAHGRIKHEGGIHRLSRVSPFDQADRRQTSFAAVEVLPVAPAESDLVLDPNELRIHTCCGGGPGGQKINKTEVVAVVRHLPTGIQVRSQAGRSQSDNKLAAMEILRAKLIQLRAAEREAEVLRLRKCAPKAGFGNAYRRTYVLSQHPGVHDHLTKKKTTRVNDVLNGCLDDLVQ